MLYKKVVKESSTPCNGGWKREREQHECSQELAGPPGNKGVALGKSLRPCVSRIPQEVKHPKKTN